MLIRLNELMKGRLGPKEELEVLDIFDSLTEIELNTAIVSLSLTRLLSQMDDHWIGLKNRQRLLEILTIERLGVLTLESKSKLLSAFQKGWTPKGQEEAICRIFVSTSGNELDVLKSKMESGVAFEDLHNLIYHDIDDKGIREKILAHFKANTPTKASLKILSDIDDTIYANWKDEKYRKKTPYPGMVQLLKRLNQSDDGGSRSDLVFITARPKEPTKIAVRHAEKTLRRLGFSKPIILPGRLHQFFTSSTILERKWKNFMEYKRLYPNHPFIFFGDSGQGDADLAVRMLKKKGIVLALIHRIHPYRSQKWEDSRSIDGMFFFNNAIEAMEKLRTDGFLDNRVFKVLTKIALDEAAEIPGRRGSKRLKEHQASYEKVHRTKK